MRAQHRSESTSRPRSREEAALAAVRDAIRAIEFGSVLIKIHQGDVVGIETSRKVRLAEDGEGPHGS
jgi:hypothetical protein